MNLNNLCWNGFSTSLLLFVLSHILLTIFLDVLIPPPQPRPYKAQIIKYVFIQKRFLVETPQGYSLCTTTLHHHNLLEFLYLLVFWKMFTAYHAIMFAVLLIGGAGVIFQASSGDDSLANNPIPVKATESKFDLNTY